MKTSLALAAVALAALPWSPARAHGNVSIRVETPAFGIRIGTPFPVFSPAVVVAPAPVYVPPPVIYAPPVIVPAPVYCGAPVLPPPGHYRKPCKVKHYPVKYDKHRDWHDD